MLSLPALALIAGCSSSIDPQRDSAALEVPAFLSSPGMALVTNTDGFTAQVEVQTPVSAGTKTISGKLLGRGSKLLFVPDVSGSRHASQQTSFIWDVAENRGYVLNEALQAYAPYSVSARIISATVDDVAVSDNISGHRCRRGEASITTSETTDAKFTVWRATDLKGFPMQIKAVSGMTLIHFSKVNFERVGSSLFVPPDGFTRHTSPEAMLGTLLERQVSTRKKSFEPDENDATAPQQERSTRAPR